MGHFGSPQNVAFEFFNNSLARVWILSTKPTRQVYNLFQEPVEQPPLSFSIAEEKIRQF